MLRAGDDLTWLRSSGDDSRGEVDNMNQGLRSVTSWQLAEGLMYVTVILDRWGGWMDGCMDGMHSRPDRNPFLDLFYLRLFSSACGEGRQACWDLYS